MKYQEALVVLSQCGLGAVLVKIDSTILEINEAGDRLLHGDGKLKGARLIECAPYLWQEPDKKMYQNVGFGEYLVRCPAPEMPDLPQGARMLVFRSAASDVFNDMLLNVLEQMSESVILCDADSRICMLNDAAIKMDSVALQDVLGEKITSVYIPQDGAELFVPQTIERKKPKLNFRQYYTTRYGKNVDIMASTYPIVQNGQLLGGFSIMEDWSRVDSLHKQIVDLQGKLLDRNGAEKTKQKSMLNAKYRFEDIIHISGIMNDVVARCKQVAKTDSSVMIYGETGTGKELFAQSIHNASERADGPFLAINCAAIPENLLESLLFGTEKGAYTGAERRPGLFEQANTGTLLLDEINSMNITLQSKLLRVLQDGIIRRVGGMSEIHVDVRVLSNINIPPYQAIAENKLRRDLFYRLGVVNINVPPLRERREDIPLLAKHFIMQCNKKLVRNVRGIDKTVLERFNEYDWPGNVRELQHAIEHAMNILPDDASLITLEYVPEHVFSGQNVAEPEPERVLYSGRGRSLNHTIQELERSTICKVLREHGGNISESARVLKMSRQNLQYRIKRYQIDLATLLKSPDTD